MRFGHFLILLFVMLYIHTGNMKQDIDSDTLHGTVCKLNKRQSEDTNIFFSKHVRCLKM